MQVGDGDGGSSQVADIKVNFRLAKPDSDDFWENTITERLQVCVYVCVFGRLVSFVEQKVLRRRAHEPGVCVVVVKFRNTSR